jgi:hypothetical protein
MFSTISPDDSAPLHRLLSKNAQWAEESDRAGFFENSIGDQTPKVRVSRFLLLENCCDDTQFEFPLIGAMDRLC